MNFQRIQWNSDASHALSRALGNDLAEIREEITQGVSRLWRVTHANGEISFFVTRPENRELVLVAFEGTALLAISRCIVQAASRQGFTTIRAHTKRPALLRLLRELNPEIVEYVARFSLRSLSDGRQEQINHAAAATDDNDQCTRH